MKNSEEAHCLTESIYKNLASKFNPQAKQLLINAKAYHKALLATSTAARSYIESLGRLGHECRTNGKGGTEEIGQAIFRVAEVYKDLQIKFEDCTKALFAEMILPLEQKLDNEFKNAAAEQRKYQQGHKEFLGPYQKSTAALEKFKKKYSNKGMYDEDKEAPYLRAVLKYQEKLDEFRIQGLKLAMLEERKCYTFILSHLTSVATVQLHYHDTGLDCLTEDLVTWRQMSSQPHILPRSADSFLRIIDPRPDHMNGGLGMGYGYNTAELGSVHKSPYKQISDYHLSRTPSEYSTPMQPSPSQTLQRRPPNMLPPAPPNGPRVRALYSHNATGEGQIKFNVGDTMTLVGDQLSDGWYFAYNPITNEYGWVPQSYVESAPRTIHQHTGPPPRAKSISDLKEHSLAALSSTMTFDQPIPSTMSYNNHNIPGTTRRPKSLHEPTLMKMMNDTFQPPSSSETSSVNSTSTVASQQYSAYPKHFIDSSVYQSVPGEPLDSSLSNHPLVPSGNIYSGDGGQANRSSNVPPSPPLPPPPSGQQFGHPAVTSHGAGVNTMTSHNPPLVASRPRSNSIGTYLPHAPPAPVFDPPPLPNMPPPPMPPGGGGMGSGPPPPPPPPPPPLKPSLSTRRKSLKNSGNGNS